MRFKFRNRKTGHEERNDRVEEPMEADKFYGKCHRCGKIGHRAYACGKGATGRHGATSAIRRVEAQPLRWSKHILKGFTPIKSSRTGDPVLPAG